MLDNIQNYLFLNAVMMIPITLSFSKTEWSLDSTFPAVYGMIDFLSFLFGLVNPDITVLMTIQTLGLVLITVAIYFQTHFSERYLRNRQQNK